MSFLKRALKAVTPSNPIEADADRIARVAVDAVCGDVSVGPLDGLLLKGAFERYKNNPAIQTKAFEIFAVRLASHHPALAAQLVDFLAAQVGR